jgi:Mn2+/Fe2+ NRAMP family transporter
VVVAAVVVVVIAAAVTAAVVVVVVVVLVAAAAAEQSVAANNDSRSHHARHASPPLTPSRGLRSVEIKSFVFCKTLPSSTWSSSFSVYIIAPNSRVVLAGYFNTTLRLNPLRYN